jgi:hypothetical protein
MTQVYELQPSKIGSLFPVREIVETTITNLKNENRKTKTYFQLPERIHIYRRDKRVKF